jgi:hypothetical protein
MTEEDFPFSVFPFSFVIWYCVQARIRQMTNGKYDLRQLKLVGASNLKGTAFRVPASAGMALAPSHSG